MTKHVLDELAEILVQRKSADPESSYVASLYAKGTAKIAQKVGEESVETVIEALNGNTERLKEESADLLFHLMALWSHMDIKPSEVFAVLEKRLGTSGHDEKASRKT